MGLIVKDGPLDFSPLDECRQRIRWQRMRCQAQLFYRILDTGCLSTE